MTADLRGPYASPCDTRRARRVFRRSAGRWVRARLPGPRRVAVIWNVRSCGSPAGEGRSRRLRTCRTRGSSGRINALLNRQIRVRGGACHDRGAWHYARIDAIGLPEAVNDPHAVRRLRHRPWPNQGQEMRPLQHALLRAGLPGAALEEGGHDKLCKKIKRAGGAEQYNANTSIGGRRGRGRGVRRRHEGQTCYICTQALHWKTKEGLVRMCACRGTAGFAHVSCLAEQAKILSRRPRRTIWTSRCECEVERWYT